MNPDDLVVLAKFPDPAIASIAASFLESEGIPATVSPAAGVIPIPRQLVRLFVLRRDEARARELLDDIGMPPWTNGVKP